MLSYFAFGPNYENTRTLVNDRAAAIDAVRQQAQAQRALEDASRAAEEATVKNPLEPISTIAARGSALVAQPGSSCGPSTISCICRAESPTRSFSCSTCRPPQKPGLDILFV